MPKKIKTFLYSVFKYLKISNPDKDLLEDIWVCFSSKGNPERIISMFERAGFYQKIVLKTKDILIRKLKLVLPLLVGERIIDIGAGNGKFAELINKEKNKEVTIVDVVDFNQTNLPLVLYNGKDLPFSDESFDTSLLLVVLHHCEDPIRVFEETVRVTKKRIIIIETVFDSIEEKEINSFFDWFANIILLKREINIPLNYFQVSEWKKTFKQNKLKIQKDIDLGWEHQPISPEHRYLFVLDKHNC